MIEFEFSWIRCKNSNRTTQFPVARKTITLWKQMILLAIAGAAGTLSRYGLSSLIQKYGVGSLPWGTIAVNLIGCFLFGIIWSLAEDRQMLSPQARFVLLTGFMGAFTTFSTLVFETSWFIRNSQLWLALANSVGQLIAGVMLILLGLAVVRQI